jgi:hypothetical protein
MTEESVSVWIEANKQTGVSYDFFRVNVSVSVETQTSQTPTQP